MEDFPFPDTGDAGNTMYFLPRNIFAVYAPHYAQAFLTHSHNK
jgi:hypothetical protein